MVKLKIESGNSDQEISHYTGAPFEMTLSIIYNEGMKRRILNTFFTMNISKIRRFIPPNDP